MSIHPLFEHDELLDLVNDNDEVIGQKNKSEIYALGIHNFRVINAFLVNDHGQLWVPRRTAHKKLFPLCLDASVGGHVQSGETYQQAFERELFEELRLLAHEVSYTHVAYLNPTAHDVSAHMHVYLIKYNQIPDYNRDDFESFQWMTISQLLNAINQGDRIKGDLPAILRVLDSLQI